MVYLQQTAVFFLLSVINNKGMLVLSKACTIVKQTICIGAICVMGMMQHFISRYQFRCIASFARAPWPVLYWLELLSTRSGSSLPVVDGTRVLLEHLSACVIR